MGYVDGSISPPPATLPVAAKGTRATPTVTIPNPYFEVWSIIDAQLCACLLAIISPSVKNNLHGLTATAAIWSHLQLRYNSLSRTHIFQLKEQLHNIQKGGDSMQKYLDSVVKIVAALDRAKSTIPEQDVILCVLRGLLYEYFSIKQNIRTNIATVTVAQVSSWLLTEELTLQIEQRIQLHQSTSNTEPHTALLCWKWSLTESESWPSGPSISTPQAFYASQSANSNENWFLNTGANAHVTADLSRHYSHTPYSGTETVTSASGHPLPIAHVGLGKIPTASGIFHLAQGFTSTTHDTSLFIKHSAQGTLILLLYVDDIVITGSSTSLIQSFIRSMHHEFQMKDLGPLKYFLGLEVQCTTNRLLLYQTKYASELIHRAGVDSTTTTPSPISPSTYTNGADTLFSNPRMFHSLVSGLQYLTVTKPDIQYAVNYVAQKMHNPTDQDFHTLNHILRYVKGTLTHGLAFGKGDMRLRGYSDSNWANDP
nr:Retrovirus-related Pol polyprotein from transposon RE1 [Ipomoea batatas]